jgi:hypothetical protein
MGFLEFSPPRFEEYPAFPAIRQYVEQSNGSSEFDVPPPNADDFDVRAWDAQGRDVPGVTLMLQGLVAIAADTEGDSSTYQVQVIIILPGTTGFTRVELLENNVVVHEWNAGPRAPQIDSLTMSESPDGLLIEWETMDPDGDDFTHMVMLVDANGDMQTLDTGTTQDSLIAPLTNSHGPGPHRAYLGVSDGINTSWAVTDPLRTTNQPPQFMWDNTTEYATNAEGTFRLDLWVLDPEGEQLGSQIVWTSNIDGLLTTGSSLDIFGGSVDNGPTLTSGAHQITATVTDSGGASSSISFTLVVSP